MCVCVHVCVCKRFLYIMSIHTQTFYPYFFLAHMLRGSCNTHHHIVLGKFWVEFKLRARSRGREIWCQKHREIHCFIAVRADRAMERRESITLSMAHVSEATFMYASGYLDEPCEYDAPNQWHLLFSNRYSSINIFIVNTNSISLLACQLCKMYVSFCSLFLSFCPPMLIVFASRCGGLVQ